MIDVKRAIADQLRKLFPEAKIYREQVESGFIQPSFFVSKIDTSIAPATFSNEVRTYGYQVVYFPNPKTPNADIDRAESILLDSFVRLDDFARISNRETTIQDKTLIYEFDVNIFTNYVDEQETMQHLKTENRRELF